MTRHEPGGCERLSKHRPARCGNRRGALLTIADLFFGQRLRHWQSSPVESSCGRFNRGETMLVVLDVVVAFKIMRRWCVRVATEPANAIDDVLLIKNALAAIPTSTRIRSLRLDRY